MATCSQHKCYYTGIYITGYMDKWINVAMAKWIKRYMDTWING